MPGTNQFVPFGTNDGANVLTPAAWAATPARQAGFQVGIADPAQANTAWRQPSSMASAIGGFIAQQGYDAFDNGDINALRTAFANAVQAYVNGVLPPSLLRYGLDVSTTPGTITVSTFTPALNTLQNGQLFEIVPNTTTNGATSATLAGATMPVQTYSGLATKAGDIIVGRPALFGYYNGALILLSPSRSEVGLWSSTDPLVLLLTPAGARTSEAFTAGRPFADFPGGATGTTGLPSPYTVVQTITISGASYIDATGVVGFRCTNVVGADCRARIYATGGGLTSPVVGAFLGCRTVNFNQIPCAIGINLQNLNPAQSLTLQLIVDRTETSGMVEVYDPVIRVRHNGNP